jgi:glycosyltransferase involved in cell wall biosynthesis
MRIGIDATPLPKEPVGAGTYIIELIRAVTTYSADYEESIEGLEFFIFAHQSGRKLINIPASPRVNWIIRSEKPPMHRLIWEQTMLPILISQLRIDLLHSLHYTRPAILPCASVVTFHDMTFLLYPHLHSRIKRMFFPLAIRFSAKQSHTLIATSERTRQDSIRLLNIPAHKIITVLNGISEEFRPISDVAELEKCRRKHGLPEEFILYVGLIEPRKNLPLLLRAYARLVLKRSCPALVIAGRFGWMCEDIARQLEALDLKDKVLFTGYLPAQDLPMVYNLAQIFVYPSLYEGFGFPPLEAMSCGTPVITTSVSAMIDHVGDAGILIPPQDEDALLEAMYRLLGDRELRKNLSIRGRERSANFTWKRTAQETLKVYRRVETTETKNTAL